MALLVDSGAWQSRTLAQSPPDVPGLAQVSEAAGTWSFPSPGSLEAHLSAQGRLIHGYSTLAPSSSSYISGELVIIRISFDQTYFCANHEWVCALIHPPPPNTQ